MERRQKWVLGLGLGGFAAVGAFVGGITLIVLLLASPFLALQKSPGTTKITNTAGIPADLVALITSAANDAGCAAVTPALLAAQLHQESGFNATAVNARSGAEGIAQFMPGTWATQGGGGDVFDPKDAIPAAARYDCAVAASVAAVATDDPRATMLAAYDAGPGNVLAFGGVPPFPETQNYVQSIIAQATVYGDDLSGGTVVEAGTVAPMIAFMRAQVGKPYVWGATGPNAWDCSSLVQAAYATIGVGLHRTTFDQVGDGERVSGTDMQPGDLLFTAGSDGTAAEPGHVAMYVGDGQVIDARGARWGVVVSALTDWTDVVAVVRPLAAK